MRDVAGSSFRTCTKQAKMKKEKRKKKINVMLSLGSANGSFFFSPVCLVKNSVYKERATIKDHSKPFSLCLPSLFHSGFNKPIDSICHRHITFKRPTTTTTTKKGAKILQPFYYAWYVYIPLSISICYMLFDGRQFVV